MKGGYDLFGDRVSTWADEMYECGRVHVTADGENGASKTLKSAEVCTV